MVAKRIIPCLDVKDGKVVKGINFVKLKKAGDPAIQAEIYFRNLADEIVFLDITASYEGRKTMIDVVRRTAQKVFIPLTVGGGIGSIMDIKNILRAGADKVSINTKAVKDPSFIKKAAKTFGSQCIVVAIDAKRENNRFIVYIYGGKVKTDIDAVKWAKKVESLGAGEILLTSIDADGTKNGYDIELTKTIADKVKIPVIASGGAGSMEDFFEVFKKTNASAALAASVFHFGEINIVELKKYLKSKNIEVRI